MRDEAMGQVQVHEHSPRNAIRDAALQKQLLLRRQRLQQTLPNLPHPEQLMDLLREVDSALERMEAGTFGICETCHDTIENDRLLADPLSRNCLDHLSPAEQQTLERDLDLAFQIQSGLLPKPGLAATGWSMAYHYRPVGPVSGDYCDLIVLEDGTGFFLVGDVMGKGVAASMLMAHLHAIFRTLATAARPVHELVGMANRVFCEGTLSSYFATLVCGSLSSNGNVQICNAGHCYPLHFRNGSVSGIESTGLPLGLYRDAEYSCCQKDFSTGDGLVVYSDGLSESFNSAGDQYGVDRLSELIRRRGALRPEALLAAVLDDLGGFRSSAPRTDDLTVMIIRRES
jgi:phosphoserine phosphatase RsbU/P